VCEVVRLAARMANHALREKAELALNLAPTPHVLGDDSQLGQVFLNLLVNAAQAFPERRTQGNKIEVTTSMDDRGQVLVEIRDNGTGIAPASLPRIFDPFFTTKPVGEGTGLGLTICQQLIADHGGQISVQSELGKGTVFRVELPPVPA
jgi:signal transduction histidine kinase